MASGGIAERVLCEPTPRKVADAAEKIAGGSVREIDASLPGALAGERAQVRAYVHAYRALTEEMLGAIHTERPDLVVLDSAGRPMFVADIKSFPGPTPVDWTKVALEQKAMSAPFSEWVGTYGAGRGTAVELVAHLRRTLRGTQPLVPPRTRRLPDWPIDERRVVDFYHEVLDELTGIQTPLEHIASVFGLTQTELSRLFGVRRQAIEQWEGRGVPSERQEKLATLGEIADLLAVKLKRERIPGVVRRAAPAYRGRSILQAIADGDEGLVLAELRDAFDWASAA